jgi:hypothetical protein
VMHVIRDTPGCMLWCSRQPRAAGRIGLDAVPRGPLPMVVDGCRRCRRCPWPASRWFTTGTSRDGRGWAGGGKDSALTRCFRSVSRHHRKGVGSAPKHRYGYGKPYLGTLMIFERLLGGPAAQASEWCEGRAGRGEDVLYCAVPRGDWLALAVGRRCLALALAVAVSWLGHDGDGHPCQYQYSYQCQYRYTQRWDGPSALGPPANQRRRRG